MKTYTKPEIEVKQFANADIITVSNETKALTINSATGGIGYGTLQ